MSGHKSDEATGSVVALVGFSDASAKELAEAIQLEKTKVTYVSHVELIDRAAETENISALLINIDQIRDYPPLFVEAMRARVGATSDTEIIAVGGPSYSGFQDQLRHAGATAVEAHLDPLVIAHHLDVVIGEGTAVFRQASHLLEQNNEQGHIPSGCHYLDGEKS